ncbi:hypothetical protein, partial [Aeromonas lacus]|uniref:hypothetical protein n=1 Tax=Aeromonas lacus TaxID=558884 RepID=UPI001EE69D11
YNSESFLDFDWSNKNLFVEIGPCGWFSKFVFSERPYNSQADTSEAIKRHECVHFNIPVKFSALMTSDYEQALIESLKKILSKKMITLY